MATQLSVYARALQHLGEERLASLTEDRPPRYWLDDAWTESVQICAEETDWWFLMLTVSIEADPELETSFGYEHVHNKPDDWLRTSGVYSNEHLTVPVRYYLEEGDNYFSDIETIYVQYIPSVATILNDIASWPQYFADYVAVELAYRISGNVKNFAGMAALKEDRKEIKKNATSLDAMKQPSKQLPTGSWLKAIRTRRGGPRGDDIPV